MVSTSTQHTHTHTMFLVQWHDFQVIRYANDKTLDKLCVMQTNQANTHVRVQMSVIGWFNYGCILSELVVVAPFSVLCMMAFHPIMLKLCIKSRVTEFVEQLLQNNYYTQRRITYLSDISHNYVPAEGNANQKYVLKCWRIMILRLCWVAESCLNRRMIFHQGANDDGSWKRSKWYTF